MNTTTNNASRSQLYTLITVFFFWGFVAASNGILIPLFKEKFSLSQFQSQLVDFAFYAAYFVGSLLYFLVSRAIGGDPLNRIGYKNGIVYGLLLSAVGAVLFYPAASMGSYPLLLAALFTVGLGFSLQQTAAQTLTIALGDPATGNQRLNLAGGVNNFGTTIGPVLISFAIFGAISENAAANATIDSVKIPYLVLAGVFVIFAIFFKYSNLPSITNNEAVETGSGALKFPQLTLGMVAIFVYVGVEVSIASNLGEYLRQTMNLDSAKISQYVSLFWASMMIGRWSGAVSAFNPTATTEKIMKVVVPYVAFGVFIVVNILRGSDLTDLYVYGVCILVLIAANFMGKDRPARMLLIYSILGAVAMLIGLLSTGTVALFAFISGGLFCSVMWPCIFPLAIAGLGKYTNQGASFLIMMILGGAIIPPMQGKFADSIGIHYSYIVALVCFLFLAWFSVRVKTILKSQGIDYEANMGGGH